MKKKKFLAVFSTMAIAASMLAAMPASAASYDATKQARHHHRGAEVSCT